MNKYVFIILPAVFSAPRGTPYDEVEHKKLNEDLEKIRLLIMATDMKEGMEKGKHELQQIIAANFNDVAGIGNYAFRLHVVEVQNY